MNENKEIEAQESQIRKTILVKEAGEDVYKIDGELDFSVDFISADEKKITGSISTEILIGDTELESLETWRYKLTDIEIESLCAASKHEVMIYRFKAKNFEVKA